MTPLRFTKMQGCGNDYIYIDAWRQALPDDLPRLARQLSDRHFGIGADGLIIVGPSASADARMQMFNSDGSEAEMCGNGIRCAAKLAHDHGHVRGAELMIQTGAGPRTVTLLLQDGACVGARVAMGVPGMTPAAVPVRHPGPGPRLDLRLELSGAVCELIAVGMGNPHAVCFVDDVAACDVAGLGAAIERHPVFPNRVNVSFVQRLADERGVPVLRQRTWERGSGETLACGTGACAVTVAAILSRRIAGREAIVRLSGGDLRIAWADDAGQVIMSGPATTVFEGTLQAPGAARAGA